MSVPCSPLVICLEIKDGAETIDMSDMAGSLDDEWLTIGKDGKSEKQRHKKEQSPMGSTSSSSQAVRSYKGTRTYSDVVVETLDRPQEGERTPERETSADSHGVPIHDLPIFSGHKQQQKTEGLLHFYKYNDGRQAVCRTICVMGVSAHLTCSDVLSLFAPALPSIERIKVVNGSGSNTYMMLLLFKTVEDAGLFYTDFNGQRFNSLELDLCVLLFVERIECVSEDVLLGGPLVELPTCAVCLERMDDGVITIFCRHSFHAVCIQKCPDTICPVCRSSQTPEVAAEQKCACCEQTSTDLWMCLICGNVACGRYVKAHANRHFMETNHTFAKEVGGNRVWDYAGDNYVHRLIQAETDGKPVAYERQLQVVEGDEKMEALTLEYTCLLTNQLEDQRQFYEKKIAECERAKSNLEKLAVAQMDDLEAQLKRAVEECENLREEQSKGEQTKANSDKKHQSITNKLNKVMSELEEERTVNAMLRSDRDKWQAQVEQLAHSALHEKTRLAKELQELRDQVNDLMMHLEAKDKISGEMGTGRVTQEEMETSTVEVTPSPPANQHRRRKKK